MHWKIRKINRVRIEWNDGRNTKLEWIGRMGEYIELGCIGMT